MGKRKVVKKIKKSRTKQIRIDFEDKKVLTINTKDLRDILSLSIEKGGRNISFKLRGDIVGCEII